MQWAAAVSVPDRGMTEVKISSNVLEIAGGRDAGLPKANWTNCSFQRGSSQMSRNEGRWTESMESSVGTYSTRHKVVP